MPATSLLWNSFASKLLRQLFYSVLDVHLYCDGLVVRTDISMLQDMIDDTVCSLWRIWRDLHTMTCTITSNRWCVMLEKMETYKNILHTFTKHTSHCRLTHMETMIMMNHGNVSIALRLVVYIQHNTDVFKCKHTGASVISTAANISNT